MRLIRTLNRWLIGALSAILVVLVLAMILAAFGQVIARRFFDRGWSDLNTVLQHAVLWIAFLGAVVATERQKHIKIDILSQMIPVGARRWLLVPVNLSGVALCGLLCWAGWVYLWQLWKLSEGKWSINDNPLVNGVLFVGFGLLSLEFLVQLLECFVPAAGADPGTPKEERT
jgi:TRAP-type C4-dicarboxylate transport system permease small subunit